MTDNIDTVDTPAFVINEEVALKNIINFQNHCDRSGLDLRPHIKTHKSVHFAKAQIGAGAIGITCQKISEAEAMVAEGIDDVFITYNIFGPKKLSRLREISDKLSALSVVADSLEVVKGLGSAFENAPQTLNVLVECDTGAKRCGVQSPLEAVKLAKEIYYTPGLVFGGLMTYPAVNTFENVLEFMSHTKSLLEGNGLICPVISSGGSPDMWKATDTGIITEYRIGTYIYNDRSLVDRDICGWADCAAHVLATVVSTPTPERAIIDAGAKVLTSDLSGFLDYGYVRDHPEVSIVGLSEEHGILKVNPEKPLAIGERIWIVPNHVCVVSNMFDKFWINGKNGSFYESAVDARGCVI